MFGDESQFARFLGAPVSPRSIWTSTIFQSAGPYKSMKSRPGRRLYPVGDGKLGASAVFVFRLEEVDVPREQQLAFVRRAYKGAG